MAVKVAALVVMNKDAHGQPIPAPMPKRASVAEPIR
jgi:hypothetical protein